MIWFVLGPSGAGRSTFCEWLGSKTEWRHYEIDCWGVDGIDLHELRAEWDLFLNAGKIHPLAGEIGRRVAEARKEHAVLSFPSQLVLRSVRLRAAAEAGIRVVYLYGSPQDCLNSFLEREGMNGRNLTAEHWKRFNVCLYQEISKPEYAKHIVSAFANGGVRKTCAEIFAEMNISREATESL
jgi:adenylate kinase family enzyme